MTIMIDREKLTELVDKGIRTYYIEKRRLGSKPRMKEIETYVAFDKEDGFIGEFVKKEEA